MINTRNTEHFILNVNDKTFFTTVRNVDLSQVLVKVSSSLDRS